MQAELLEKEYDTVLDAKKRVTIRGKAKYKNFHVKEFSNGIIVLEPRELKVPDDISENTLKMVYSSIKNFKKGKVGSHLDFSKYKKYLDKE